MKNILLIFVILFSNSIISGQSFPTPSTHFFGKVNFDNAVVGGTADAVTDLTNFNDQTSQNHLINIVAIGDVIFDQSGNIWEVTVVNSASVFVANVDLHKISGSATIPFGNANIARPTTNLKLIPTSTVNALGVAEKVQAEIDNYNKWKIDEIISKDTFAITSADTIFFPSGDTIIVTDTFAITSADTIFFPSGDTIIVTDDQAATEVVYNNTTSGLDSTHVQGAIDELAALKVSYYDAGQGFWVMATAGITVTSSAAGTYTMNVPLKANIEFYHKNFTAANIGTELDGSGNFTLTSNFNQNNTGWNDANLPHLTGFANGQQYFLGATGQSSVTGINFQFSAPSAGSYTTTFTGVSGSVGGVPTQIKGSF